MTTGLYELIRDLEEQDWWSRQRLISGLLGHPARAQFMAYLEDCIRDHENANRRNTAMEVYKALGVSAFPSLSSLTRDEDPEVRLFAVNILHEIGSAEALPLLFSAIRDPDVNVRTASAEAMGKTGDPRALAALKEALDDEPWVAMAAISALGEIGGEGALSLLHECLGRKGYEAITISALKEAGNRHSISWLTDCLKRSDLREPALAAVIRIAEREQVRPQPEYFMGLVPVLRGMLGSSNPELRRHAFIAICWSAEIEGLSYLLDAVRDEELREYAIEGLLRIGRKAVCGIVDELKATWGGHRVILAKILSMIGENRALLQFAGDEDPEVRVEVALALCTVDLDRAAQELRKMLSDPCDEVRQAAGKSLGGHKT